MKKPEVIEPVRERWSPYSFSSRPVEEEKLESMFEAAARAPSSMNEQPWVFVFTTKDEPEKFRKFSDFLYSGNKVWAINAHVLIVILARITFTKNNNPNPHALYDTGMAVANMLAQATAEGLHAHQMGGFYPDRVKEYLGLGDTVVPVALMAAGYLGDGNELSEELRGRDAARRPRKGLIEFVFNGDLAKPAFQKHQK